MSDQATTDRYKSAPESTRRLRLASLVALLLVAIVVAAGAIFYAVDIPTNTMPAFIITLIIASKRGLQSRIPYGPYLALAALVWLFWGEHIWWWYLHLLMPTPM